MIYRTKEGSKTYEYIKGILDAEEKEYQAYMKRVNEAVGFEFDKWQGYQPNHSLRWIYDLMTKEYLISEHSKNMPRFARIINKLKLL